MADKENNTSTNLAKRMAKVNAALHAGCQAFGGGELHLAELKFKEVLSLDEGNALAKANLGLIAQAVGRHDLALSLFKQAMKPGIENSGILLALGYSTNALHQWEQAANYYEKAIVLDAGSAEAYYNYGKNCQDSGDLSKALGLYQKSITLNPHIIECHCNMGLVYIELGKLDEAIEVLKTATSLRPDHIMSHYNLAIALLSNGELKTGWEAYESRIDYPDGRVRQLPFKTWQGESLRSKHLLVYAEQGVGDEVMFSSCLENLIKEDAASITLECDPRLAALFARSFPEITVVANKKDHQTQWEKLFPTTDLKVSLASLPHFYRNTIEEFPGRAPYLVPDKGKLKRWEERLAALGEEPKIGIAWRGGAKEKTRQQRSTSLLEWAPVLENSGFFINLQYGDCREEINQLEQELGIKLYDWDDANPLKDLDDFYAQVASLDLVISVDNSTVHFAGAAGTPVWNLLPEVPEFRWMLHRSDTPWYPCMQLFRQCEGGWNVLIEQVAGQLQKHLTGSGS